MNFYTSLQSIKSKFTKPLDKKERCRYCTSYLSLHAKVCTVCGRHRKRFFNHFRTDHIGIVITIVMMVLAYRNLNFSYLNLDETRKKRVEATAALERVERAEITLNNLQTLLAQAQDALSDLRSNAEFNILLTKATNDDRTAFNRMVEISLTPGPFQDLAESAVARLVMDVDPMVSVRVGPNVPWDQYNIDPSRLSLQEFQAQYNAIHPLYRPRYLSELWSQERFAKGERLQMLFNIIQNESSLRALHRACVLMNLEAKINKNILGAHEYLLWWEQNKSRYASPIQ